MANSLDPQYRHERVVVFVTSEEKEAIQQWCVLHRVPMSDLGREAMMARIEAREARV